MTHAFEIGELQSASTKISWAYHPAELSKLKFISDPCNPQIVSPVSATVPLPPTYLRSIAPEAIHTRHMQIKRNRIKRRFRPLFPIHNPVPPILYPIRLSQLTARFQGVYPINDIQMIHIPYGPLVFSPHCTGNAYQTIIRSFFSCDYAVTCSEYGAPCGCEGGAERVVQYVWIVGGGRIEGFHVCCG